LSTLHFDQIGTINKNIQGEYYIDSIPAIGGPFSKASDYYRAWALSQKDNPRQKNQSVFPQRVSSASEFLSSKPNGPFTLSHPDFGYHNILVDNDYNMIAVIDWGGAQVRPIEFSSTFPMFLSSLHPSIWHGGRFDTKERRHLESILASQQLKYKTVMDNEANRLQVASNLDPRGLRAMIAGGIIRYSDGDMNPWEWLIDFLERDRDIV
jgi:hypothetical protein